MTWLWNVSRTELKTTYLPQRYIFMASTYQAAILTQFNETDSLSFKELHQGTMLAEGVLKPQLALLCKAKVLIQDEDQYDLNLSELSLFFSLPLRCNRKGCESN